MLRYGFHACYASVRFWRGFCPYALTFLHLARSDRHSVISLLLTCCTNPDIVNYKHVEFWAIKQPCTEGTCQSSCKFFDDNQGFSGIVWDNTCVFAAGTSPSRVWQGIFNPGYVLPFITLLNRTKFQARMVHALHGKNVADRSQAFCILLLTSNKI